MSTTVTGIIQGAGVAGSVTIAPGASDNVVVVIISGNYTGFEGEFETSTDGVSNWQPLVGISMSSYQQDGPFITPQSGNAQSWGFNITVANKGVRLRPLAYGAGEVDVTIVSLVLAGGIPIITPLTQTPVDRSLQGAAASLAPTMPAVAGKTNYVTDITIDGTGSTAGLVTAAILSGLKTSLAFPFVVPVGVNTPLGGGKLSIHFDPPFVASGPNVAIVFTVPSFGSGNLFENASIRGFVQ